MFRSGAGQREAHRESAACVRAADLPRAARRGARARLAGPFAARVHRARRGVWRLLPPGEADGVPRIAAVLGAPAGDAPRLHRWSNMVQRQFDIQALATRLPDIERAAVEAREYVTRLLEDREDSPGTDLISTLIQ